MRENKQQYEIYGKTTGVDMEGSLIYLAGLEGNTLIYADSTVISDSTFVFTGIQDKPQIKFLIPLRSVCSTYVPKPFILENGIITASINNNEIYVSGTELNDELNKYRKKKAEFRAEKSTINNAYKDSMPKMSRAMERSFIEQYKDIEIEETSYIDNLINKNNDNVLGGYILLENKNLLSNKQKQSILSKASEDFFLLDGVTSIDEAMKRRNNLKEGRKIADTKLINNQDGEYHQLSEYTGKGNFLIINFWASWSVPSVAAIYDIKTIAQKYNHKGVGILSISLDTVYEEWSKTIKQKGMQWTNLADLKGWDSGVTMLYQINYIPNYMLINPDGTIVMTEGSLEDIDSKLNQLLNN